MELAYKFQKKVDEISDVICEYFNISELDKICNQAADKAEFDVLYEKYKHKYEIGRAHV